MRYHPQTTHEKLHVENLPRNVVAQVNSKESPSVQLADVLIGAMIEATNILTGLRRVEIDPMRVIRLYRDDQFIHLIPSLDFDEQKKFRAGSQAGDVIDYFSKHFHK